MKRFKNFNPDDINHEAFDMADTGLFTHVQALNVGEDYRNGE